MPSSCNRCSALVGRVSSRVFCFNFVFIWLPWMSDSVVVGISTLCPVVFWLFHGICNLGDGLHILQTKFYGHQQTEWRPVINSEGLTVEVGREQRLWMTGRRQID